MSPDHVLRDDHLRPKVLLPLLSAFHRSLPLIAGCGFPLIIDHVIERRDWMNEIAAYLEGFEVYMVKVTCPLEELERREVARGDRQIGFAKMQSSLVHRFIDSDAEVDSFGSSLEGNVETLRKLVSSKVKPKALDLYRAAAPPPGPSERDTRVLALDHFVGGENP